MPRFSNYGPLDNPMLEEGDTGFARMNARLRPDQLKAGEIIYCNLPESHGFNAVEKDKYISGLYIITEVKQVIASGNKAATTLRINKDGYLNSLFEKSLYNVGSLSIPGIGRA